VTTATLEKPDVVDQQTVRKLPEGIIHLHGDLYRVRHDLIEYASEGFDPASTEFVFQNPRHISDGTESGKTIGHGFSKEAMDELREAIRTEGLDHPLVCRWLPGNQKVQIVAGERRKRCLDKLRKDKETVFDPTTQQMVSAADHYNFIECRISEMDEKTALKRSISETETGKSFGEGALVLLVRHLRTCGMDDKEILATMSKSPSWLKQSDDILKLDEKCFKSFCTDKINRTVALQLVNIPDVTKRIQLLGKASEIAQQRIAQEIKKLDAQIEGAQTDLEHAEGEAAAADVQGTPAQKKRAMKKVRAARDKVTTKQKAKETAKGKGTAKVIDKDLRKAAKSSGTDGDDEAVKPKSLTGVKVKKHYVDILASIIRRGGKTEDGEEVEFEIEELQLAKTISECIYKGEADVLKALAQYTTGKHRRQGTTSKKKK